MPTFVIYADWGLGRAIDADLVSQVDTAWDPDDKTFCSAPSRHDPDVLSLSFDVDAANEEEASRTALARIDDLVHRLALPGHLSRLRGYTDDGWFEAELGD